MKSKSEIAWVGVWLLQGCWQVLLQWNILAWGVEEYLAPAISSFLPHFMKAAMVPPSLRNKFPTLQEKQASTPPPPRWLTGACTTGQAMLPPGHQNQPHENIFKTNPMVGHQNQPMQWNENILKIKWKWFGITKKQSVIIIIVRFGKMRILKEYLKKPFFPSLVYQRKFLQQHLKVKEIWM